MNEAAERMEYEKAATNRDLLNSVRQIMNKQKITNTDQEDRDIIAFARNKDEAVVQTFFIRGGKLIGRDHFYLTGVEDETDSRVITSFIKQFYAGTPYIPKEIFLDAEPEEEEVLTQWLTNKRGNRVYLMVPKRGKKEKLVELAKKNALLILTKDAEKLKREEARTTGALKELADYLDIPHISRIEAFDISNTSGFETVGSMVVFEQGKAKKSDYRKFKIKTVQGQDDYGALYEMLMRRFMHGIRELEEIKEKKLDAALGSFTKYPDLILMDGGKGQVNIALQVLEELKLDIEVCGMVKDDNHRTRGLYYRNKELPIDKSSEMFKLITRIQDETHRFAIEYRSLRKKRQVHSILDDIKGIGPTRRKALMKHFESIEAIREAEIDELLKVPTMNKASATEVYNFFRKPKTNKDLL